MTTIAHPRRAVLRLRVICSARCGRCLLQLPCRVHVHMSCGLWVDFRHAFVLNYCCVYSRYLLAIFLWLTLLFATSLQRLHSLDNANNQFVSQPLVAVIRCFDLAYCARTLRKTSLQGRAGAKIANTLSAYCQVYTPCAEFQSEVLHRCSSSIGPEKSGGSRKEPIQPVPCWDRQRCGVNEPKYRSRGSLNFCGQSSPPTSFLPRSTSTCREIVPKQG